MAITGSLFQPGNTFGVIVHSTAFSVAPAGISDLTEIHPQ